MTILFIFLFICAIFMFGAILGSFLNVVAVDSMNVYMKHGLEHKSESRFVWNTLKTKEFWRHLVTHRSSCDTCSTTLTPKELVPVVSYLWQKGHCNSCQTSFSPQHLYVELLAGALFTGVFLHVFNSHPLLSGAFVFELIYMTIFFALAIIMFLFDYKEMIVPNLTVYPMLVLAFGMHIFGFASVPDITLTESVIAAVFVGLPLFLLWAVSKGTWMGMADSKIGLVIGALLGGVLGFTALILSFWIGAAVGIILILVSKYTSSQDGTTMKTAIPFGPFMILAFWFVYITQYNLFIT